VTRYELSPRAKAAIAEIHDYTHDQWGPKQADRYIDSLIDLFDRIVLKLVLWRPIPPDFGVQGFVWRHEQHYVCWQQYDDGAVGITAILHVSMMQADRLRDAFGS
jgi:toxin ParE1/3/4